MKRTIAILLCALLVLAFVPVSAWAIGGTLHAEEANAEEPPAAEATAQPSDAAESVLPAEEPAAAPNDQAADEAQYISYTRVGPLLGSVWILGKTVTANMRDGEGSEESGVETGKTVGEPDENGVYTLTLETFATGEVTITIGQQAVPCDIILVLDTSKSMNQTFGTGAGAPSRLAALKSAVNDFITATAADARTDSVDHRIAIVSYNDVAVNVTNGFLDAANNEAALKADVNGLSLNENTYTNKGMEAAVNIFHNDTPPAGERKRVVVLFTDGTPGTKSTGFSESVANDAIDHAKTLKASTDDNGYGCTVYSVAIYNGADPTAVLPTYAATNTDTQKINRFLHYVSDNYPNASSMSVGGTGSNAGYYLTAADPSDLNDIFSAISSGVTSGGTTVTLDETSTIQDVISDSFELETGTEADVDVYTADYLGRVGNVATGERLWDEPVPFTSPAFSVTVDAEGKTVITTGFDFSANFVADIVTNGVITGHRGSKLIIQIRIVRGDTFGGNEVETNGPGSGVYPGGSDEPLEPFDPPHTNLPIAYEVTAHDRSIYAGDEVDISDLFNFIASDGVNNAHVNVAYELYLGTTRIATLSVPAGTAYDEQDWVFLSGYQRVFEPYTCGQLQLKADVVSVEQDPDQPAECNERDFDVTARVHLFTPTVVFGDDTIIKGDTSDITDNVTSVLWADATHSAAPDPEGDAPTLRFTYDHADGTHYLADTPITVISVLRGTKDITTLTVLTADAAYPTAHFAVYVTPCTLTMQKQGAADENETFRFLVTRAADEAIAETWSITVCVHGNGSVTLTDLPIGDYSIQEDTSWSWRYLAQEAVSIRLDATHDAGELTFVNTIKTNRWLDGDSFLTNLFRLFGGN